MMKHRIAWVILSCYLTGCNQSDSSSQLPDNVALLSDVNLSMDSKDGPSAPTGPHFEADDMQRLMLAELALSRQEPMVAYEQYLFVGQRTHDVDLLERATRIAITFGSPEQALLPANLWSQAAPESVDAQMINAAIATELGVEKDIEVRFIALDKLAGTKAYEQYLLLYEQMGTPIAHSHIQTVLEKMSQNMQANVNAQVALAEIYLSQDLAPKALLLTDAILKNPNYVEQGTLLKAHTLKVLNKDEEAFSLLTSAIKKLPKNTNIQHYYAEFLLESGRTNLAKIQLDTLAREPNLEGYTLLQLARLAMQANWFDTAKTFLVQAQRVPEEANTAAYFLGRLSEMNKDLKQAMTYYQGIQEGPFHVLGNIRAAQLLSMSEKTVDKSIELLDGVQPSTYEEWQSLVLARASIYSDKKLFTEAFGVLSQGLSEAPNNIDFLFARGMVAQLGKMGSAFETDMLQIIKLEPDNVLALATLGAYYTITPATYEKAYDLLSKANSLSPNHPMIQDNLGWLYFKQGKIDKAMGFLETAYRTQPSPDIAAHYGEVLWSSGAQSKAIEILQNALKLSPENPVLKDTMSRLIPSKGQTVNPH